MRWQRSTSFWLCQRCWPNLLEAGEKAEARQVVEQGLNEYRFQTRVGRRRDARWVGKAKQLLKEVC